MSLRRMWFFLLPILIGCGQAEPPRKQSAFMPANVPAPAPSTSTAGAMPQADRALPKPESVQRKIIYKASVDLVVEDFSAVPGRLEAMVKQSDGYIAQSDISGSPGSPRSGRWTIRVPVDRYDALLAAVQGLGEIRTVASNSEDVSEEYYDIQARVRNSKKQEERLLKLLETATGKLEDVLKVENELARVRGEIECLEGRVRMLDNLTAMSTVELRVEEIKDYVPEVAPTYLTRVRRSLSGSIDLLVTTAQAVSIMLVALSPWLASVLALFLVFWLVARLFRRRNRAT